MDSDDRFRYQSIYYFGLFNIGLVIGGVLLLPVCAPVGVMFILAGSMLLLNIPFMF